MPPVASRHLLAIASSLFLLSCREAQPVSSGPAGPAASAGSASTAGSSNQRAEVACGECQFELPGTGCHLALRLHGQCYWVDGVGIDDLGDAHAADGLCNAIRLAEVEGQALEPAPGEANGRFQAESIVLVTE